MGSSEAGREVMEEIEPAVGTGKISIRLLGTSETVVSSNSTGN